MSGKKTFFTVVFLALLIGWGISVAIEKFNEVMDSIDALEEQPGEMTLVDKPAIDINKVPTFWSESAVAHGCPISPTFALTAKHVPFDKLKAAHNDDKPYSPVIWSDGYGHNGAADVVLESNMRDIVGVKIIHGDEFVHTFEKSTVEAAKGETIYIVGYDYTNHIEQRLVETKIVRNRGGFIVFEQSAKVGSSGGCIFRADGTVIGIVSAEIGETGLGISVVGKWDMIKEAE